MDELDCVMKQLPLRDARIACRVRGLSPAGGAEALAARLKAHIHATGDL